MTKLARMLEIKMTQEQLASFLVRTIKWEYAEAMEYVKENELEDLNDVVCIVSSRVEILER